MYCPKRILPYQLLSLSRSYYDCVFFFLLFLNYVLLIVRVFGKLLFHWVFSHPTNLLTCLKTRGVTILQNFCFDIGKYINFTTLI